MTSIFMIILSNLTAATPVITSELKGKNRNRRYCPSVSAFWKFPSCAQIPLAMTLSYGCVAAREAGKYKILFSAVLCLDQVLECYQGEKEE